MDGVLLESDSVGYEPGTTRERVLGQVLWFSEAKGFGFVAVLEQVTNKLVQYFVHYTEIDKPGFRTLIPGQLVSLVPQDGPRGPFCACVREVSV